MKLSKYCLSAAVLKLAVLFQTSSVPGLMPLSQVYWLACKSSCLSANPTLLALPDLYSYSPFPPDNVTAGRVLFSSIEKCKSVFILNEAVEAEGGSGGKGPQEVSSLTSYSQPAQL